MLGGGRRRRRGASKKDLAEQRLGELRADVYEAADAFQPLLRVLGMSEVEADDLALLLADLYHDVRTIRRGTTSQR